jgi:hypothetical protein
LISLFSALGLYTVPVMLFPFGILFVWLLLENLVDGPGPYRTKWEFIWHWLGAGLTTAVLTILFYTPILIFTGPQKVFANGFVSPLPWSDVVGTLADRFSETWAEWTFRVPTAVTFLFILGWILSMLFYKRLSTFRTPLQAAALSWIFWLLIIQRPNAWSKVWVFLQPLLMMWAAAGTLGLLQKIRFKVVHRLSPAAIVFGLCLISGIWHAAWLVPQLPQAWTIRGDEENTVLFVQSQLRNNDLILVAPTDDAPVWYYSDLHAIPNSYFDFHRPNFNRALVLVNLSENQTLDSVIAERGPDPGLLNVGSARLINTIGKMQIFEVPHQ